MRERDHDQQVRSLLRSKNIDMLSNTGYNLTNGQSRKEVTVPEHKVYNPPGSSGSMLGRAGAQGVFGDGFAGRPIRMQDKLFGKRVNNSVDDMYGGEAAQGPGQQQAV